MWLVCMGPCLLISPLDRATQIRSNGGNTTRLVYSIYKCIYLSGVTAFRLKSNEIVSARAVHLTASKHTLCAMPFKCAEPKYADGVAARRMTYRCGWVWYRAIIGRRDALYIILGGLIYRAAPRIWKYREAIRSISARYRESLFILISNK